MPDRALALGTKSHLEGPGLLLECLLLGFQQVECPEWGFGDSDAPAQQAASAPLPFVFVLLLAVSAPLQFVAVFPVFSLFQRAGPANLGLTAGGVRLRHLAFTG